MGYFQNFFFFSSPEKVIPPSLPRFFAFSTSFWALLYVFDKHFTTDQFNSRALHVFTSHHPSFTQNGAGGVCHHLLCSQGRCSCCVCMMVCLWVQLWKCVWKGGAVAEKIRLDVQNFWKRVRVKGARGGWEIVIVIMCFNLASWITQIQWLNL